MYGPEPDRHVYLAPYIGNGTADDPYRPRGVDGMGSWSSIDLRPDPTDPASGYAILHTSQRLPVRDENHAVYLGDDPDLPLPTIVRQHVEVRTRVGRGDLPDRMRGDRCIVADLLTLMADDNDPTRPNVLRPERDKVLRIHFGGQVWWEKALPAGGASYTDDFNRADQLLEVSADWEPSTAAGLQIVNQEVTQASGGPFYCLYRFLSALDDSDHAAQVTVRTMNFTNRFALVGARLHATDNTGYWFRHRNRDDFETFAIMRYSAGTETALSSVAEDPSAFPRLLLIEVEGSSIRGICNDVERTAVTDTVITSGLRAGIGTGNDSNTFLDDFAALDLAGPVGPFLRTTGGYLRTGSGILRPA